MSTPSRFFASPEIIDAPGKYWTRGGEVVEIISKNKFGSFGWKGVFPNGIVDSWHRGGFFCYHSQSDHDILQKVA